MWVLVACEESQAVCIEFRERGHVAFSCDILPCSGGHPEWHIKGDVTQYINGTDNGSPMFFWTQDGEVHSTPGKWDMLIAFPPCTYMTSAGACRMFHDGELDRSRYAKAMDAKEFFLKFYDAKCPRIAIENPTPMKIVGLPQYSQIIHPYEFGDPYSKRTCLWLRGLPPLFSTDIVFEHRPYVNGGNKDRNGNYRGITGCARSPRKRSKTFPGIARAMAEQWG